MTPVISFEKVDGRGAGEMEAEAEEGGESAAAEGDESASSEYGVSKVSPIAASICVGSQDESVTVQRGSEGEWTDGVEPVLVDLVRVLSSRELHGPFASLCIGRVLPRGFDALLEEVVV